MPIIECRIYNCASIYQWLFKVRKKPRVWCESRRKILKWYLIDSRPFQHFQNTKHLTSINLNFVTLYSKDFRGWESLLSQSFVMAPQKLCNIFTQLYFQLFWSEVGHYELNSNSSTRKIQSVEQSPNLWVAIIITGYIKKPNFVRLWQLQSNDTTFYEPLWLLLTKGYIFFYFSS